ncbi:hypothetical protein DPMN_037823 [Dreissena polymorpha]|uniref:Replication associated protein n=1 Tax=Dreissena polymorpha TaxID=45954 RepID=A0A9D4RQ65_DREPO|nr:hypothetical protein DPMN_037823 [Dreissena polymorpha]
MKYRWCRAAQVNEGHFSKHVKGWIIADEYGAGASDNHAHSHMVLIMKEKQKLVDMQKIIKYLCKHVPNDIQSCKNVKNCVAYVSKEDYRCVLDNIDKDWLSPITLAYAHARRTDYRVLRPTSYPYCRMSTGVQRQFREFYEFFRAEHESDVQIQMMEHVVLRRWQRAAMKMVDIQTNRQILWIYEEKGNTGKTFFGQYLASLHGAIELENGATKDLAYAYSGEPIVCFNFPRSQEGSINYHFLELLKDGCLFSSKYESRVKTFKPPKVVVFANYTQRVLRCQMTGGW